MDRLGEIISVIQYFRESCDPMEQKLAEKLTSAIALLRAGAEMRVAFTTIDDDDYTSWAVNIERKSLSLAGQAWDAALEGEDE